MGFRSANLMAHMIKFNSATSCHFLDMYNSLVEDDIRNNIAHVKHQTFAPSQMRCDRLSWFRLRGTEPDEIKTPDTKLNFTAQIGTACHEIIQQRLIKSLGGDWIPVEQWVSMNPNLFSEYDMEITLKGYESQINLKKPYPVRFACDGIIRFEDKVRLLEIKTAEYSSLNDLTEPKENHLVQVRCYSTLLHIPDVLFLYQDRQFGSLKCFELTVKPYEQRDMRKKMDNVMHLAEVNIAPEGLPKNDPDCTPNMCPYYSKCAEWGR